eukprot:3546421-Amphidinium_carterae.1
MPRPLQGARRSVLSRQKQALLWQCRRFWSLSQTLLRSMRKRRVIKGALPCIRLRRMHGSYLLRETGSVTCAWL